MSPFMETLRNLEDAFRAYHTASRRQAEALAALGVASIRKHDEWAEALAEVDRRNAECRAARVAVDVAMAAAREQHEAGVRHG